MSGILENMEAERSDLFNADAVAEIADGVAKGKTPRLFKMEWDDGAQAYIVTGVLSWEAIKPIHDALPDDTNE